MAEVGQRLGTGAYRLSALRNTQSRPVGTGESPRSLLVTRTFTDRLKEGITRDQRQVQTVARGKTTRRKKLYKVRAGESQQENGTLRGATSLELDSSRFISESLQHTAALYLSARLQPLLQEKLLPGRMTPWTRGAVSTHPDTFRSPQQVRALCTVIFILAEQGGSERLRRLKLHPDTLQGSSRSYSWSSDSRSEDAPPLHRSRTVYYDILKVTPAATQSQIKTAYYKQSFIYHPDKNPDNKEASQRFSDISEAYTVLGNISLRRKYDRGILSRSDVQSAGRPSSKETPSRSAASPQHPHRARRFSQAGGKTMFDFDAFYRAHYGEQLQREKEMRARRQRMQEQQKEKFGQWKEGKMMEMTVAMLLTMGALLFVNLSKP